MEGILDRLGKKKQRPSNESIPPKRLPPYKHQSTAKLFRTMRDGLRQQNIVPNRSSFEAGSAEHLFARDQTLPSEREVNALFDSMLERRGIHDLKTKTNMQSWHIEKKWLMVNQDHQAEMLASGVSQSKLQQAASARTSMDISRLPANQPTSSRSLSTRKVAFSRPESPKPVKSISSPVSQPSLPSINTTILQTGTISLSPSSSTHSRSPTVKRSKSINVSPIKSNSKRSTDSCLDVSAIDQNSPEFFIKKFLDPHLRSVTTKIAASLEVSLRTRPINWVVQFIELKGFHVLCHALDYLNHSDQDRRNTALELEIEIVRCIKAIVNTKVGGKEVIDHPEYIHAVVFSIVCPHWQTRKMVCELLAFLCYLDGYHHVIHGFELMKKFNKTLSIFDCWMQQLLTTLVSENDLLENHLVEYALSNMILVNALTSIPSNVNYRISIRNQFVAAGLQTHIIPKLVALDYHLLNLQIESFKEAADHDLEDAFGDDLNQLALEDSNPSQLFDKLLENISDSPKGTEHFLSMMKYLLWIKGSPEEKCQYYHIIEIMLYHIVTDGAQHNSKADLQEIFSTPIGAVMQNFLDLDRLKDKEKEADEIKEQYEKIILEKEQLEREVQELRIVPSLMENQAQKHRIEQLKEENNALRQVLQTSKDTITSLQARLTTFENQEKRRSSSDSGKAMFESMRQTRKRGRLSLDEKRLPMISLEKRSTNGYNSAHHGFSFGEFLLPFFNKNRFKKKRPVSDPLVRAEDLNPSAINQDS
ncbi:Cytokinesis protein sepA, partial [Choanephora cucurbitarum]